MIQITRTKGLSACQKKDLEVLTDDYPYLSSYSFDQEDEYFILYENGSPASVLSLFYPDDTSCEIKALTKHVFRKRGYFSVLMQTAKKLLLARETIYETSIYPSLVVPGNEDQIESATRIVLEKKAASLINRERMMKKDITDIAVPKYSASPLYEITQLCAKNDCILILDHMPIGMFSFSSMESSVYFYGFHIDEDQQHKGYGSSFFPLILSWFKSNGFSCVTLQVSDSNIPAMHIYKKAGFHTSETLSYYSF